MDHRADGGPRAHLKPRSGRYGAGPGPCRAGVLLRLALPARHAAGNGAQSRARCHDRVPPLRRLRRRLERSAGIERWRRIDRVLRWGRWLVLAWAIIGAAVTGTMVFRVADPWIALLMVAQFEVSLAFVVLVATFVLALFPAEQNRPPDSQSTVPDLER